MSFGFRLASDGPFHPADAALQNTENARRRPGFLVLQRLEGLSDREAVERYTLDTRWRYAAGVGGYDTAGWSGFVHTVLVDMRARLKASDDPKRIFNVTAEARRGLVLSVRNVCWIQCLCMTRWQQWTPSL